MKVTSVNTLDAYGRTERFGDAASREFVVTYDAQQRIAAIGVTRGSHISDITAIHYTGDGSVARVVFRNGYALVYGYRKDGTQVVHDSQMRRLPDSRVLQPIDQESASPILASTVADVESLMAALQVVGK